MFVRKNYILNLRYHVPKNVLDKSWLRPPGILENVRTVPELTLQMTWAQMELNLYIIWCCLPCLERAASADKALPCKSDAEGI